MPPSSMRSLVNPPTRSGGKVIAGVHPRTSIGDRLGLSRIEPRRKRGLRDTIRGITAPDIRRLARRGGVKRIQKNIYEETRAVLRGFLEDVRPH
jgi:hypothetical protein